MLLLWTIVLQADNDSAVVGGCMDVPSAQDESSCPQGYQFESDRGDWTIVTEVSLMALASDR
jgi:hypothetical protein